MPRKPKKHFSRFFKRLAKFLSRRFSWILIIFGISLLSFSSIYQIWQNYQFNRFRPSEIENITKNRKPLPTHITIKGYIDIPVESVAMNGNSWPVSPNNATYLIDTARPGEPGNIVIYGHNLKRIFGSLPYVKPNQIINLKTSDNLIHNYQIEWVKTVTPDRIDLLQPTTVEMLTIYTCTGPIDSLRFIVRAKPIVL